MKRALLLAAGIAALTSCASAQDTDGCILSFGELNVLFEGTLEQMSNQLEQLEALETALAACCTAPEESPPGCGDIDFVSYHGALYPLVEIGDQCWFAENLRTWNYRNGDAIPEEADGPTWAGLTTGAAAAFDNDNSNYETFGLLYNWYAVSDSRGICPSEWHGATESDFQALLTAAGGSSEADVTLRSDDVAWIGSNPDSGTDALGFGLLPGGMRDGYYGHGNFQYFQFYGALWASDFGYKFFLVNGDGEAGIYSNAVSNAGKYVRCVKD